MGISLINKLAKTIKNQFNPIYKSTAKYSQFNILNKPNGNFDSFENRLLNGSNITLIFGKRGSGKSALGFRILENAYSKTKRKCYVLGIKQELMPKWITSIESVEQAKDNSIIQIDESALAFSSRNSMKSSNKNLLNIMAIARHKNLSLFFITQNTGLVDKNILKLADTLLVKEGSLLQLEMERAEIKKFYEKAHKLLSKQKDDKRKYVYLIDSDFEGLIQHGLPSFWHDSISKNRASQ